MIGIPLGLAYANAGEWLVHKYILHWLGRNKRSFWSFHWHEHHQQARRADMLDPEYEEPLWRWGPKTKEILSLVGAALIHLPLLPVAPFFTTTVCYRAWRYYQVHRRAHLDPDWARAHVPWHVDHHMGRNQNLNWCVTHPFFDWVMGTRAESGSHQRPCARPGRAGERAV